MMSSKAKRKKEGEKTSSLKPKRNPKRKRTKHLEGEGKEDLLQTYIQSKVYFAYLLFNCRFFFFFKPFETMEPSIIK